MSTSVGVLLLIFIVFQMLCTTPGMAGVRSRDQLLSLRCNASQLNHGQRLQITSLGLRRRGCRAGNHCRRRLLAAHSVTSAVCSTSTPGEIPRIIGHRPMVVNKYQLIHGQRDGSVSALRYRLDVRSSVRSTVVLNNRPLLLDEGTLHDTTSATIHSPPSDDRPLLVSVPANMDVSSSPSHGYNASDHQETEIMSDTESTANVPFSREEQELRLNCPTDNDSDQSAVIYSPSLSVSLNTEPSSVSDLTLDLSDYCLPTLYGSPSSLVTPDARPRLSPAPSLAPKTPRFILPTVFNANIRGGFCQKTDELSVVLHQNSVDLACITETWLNPSISDNLTEIPGYITYRLDRNDGRQGGGVIILAKQELPCKPIDLPNPTHQETLWLLYRQPCMPRTLTHILIGALYFPPNANSKIMNDHILDSLDIVSRKHPNLGILLVGDFNHLPDKPLLSFPLKQIVRSSTRGLAVLDKIYTNISHWFSEPITLPAVGKSDHCSVLLTPSINPLPLMVIISGSHVGQTIQTARLCCVWRSSSITGQLYTHFRRVKT